MGVGDREDVDALAAQLRSWTAIDPDPETRAEAESLLADLANAVDAAGIGELTSRIRDAFDGRLAFGTAGLRARLGAGPLRMNRVVIAQISAGFAEYLLGAQAVEMNRTPEDRTGTAQTRPSVVIGFDGRRKSDVFARDAAEILAGAGLSVTLFPDPIPTPLLSFAVRHLGATAGLMVTASHNPPEDNGVKVFLDAGAQVTSPADHEIASAVAEAAERAFSELPRSRDFGIAPAAITQEYIRQTSEAISAGRPLASSSQRRSAQPTVVYTAMHGVGGDISRAVFAAAGLPDVISVAEQDRPDCDFPTLPYPNPEERGALDRAYALAKDHGAHFVLAQDPDADRLALAAPHPDEPGGYRRLSGNELGLLLGWRIAERVGESGSTQGSTQSSTAALATTIVSSPALGAVARAYGLAHVETLPGFKWIARVPGLVFGYEEALGYLTTPHLTGDKDGVSAAAEVLALACELHAEGRTVWELLDLASERFGHFASAQVVVRTERTSETENISRRIREDPPADFDGIAVTRVRDFERPGHAPTPANVLAFDLEDGSRVMIRPSGTEPKLKIYLDAFSAIGSAQDRRAAAAATLGRLEGAVRRYLEGVTQ